MKVMKLAEFGSTGAALMSRFHQLLPGRRGRGPGRGPPIRARVSVSVGVCFAGVGSPTPNGVATVAVLLSVPVAEGLIVPASVYVPDPPTGRLTPWLMPPAPLAVHVAPPAATHVQVTPVIVPGTVSVTVAGLAGLGPAFHATIVYVVSAP